MTPDTIALIDATGGAGTTRRAVEVAVVVARAGQDVAIDAVFRIQGHETCPSGRTGTALTTLVTDEPDASLPAAAASTRRLR
jgi:hypothetical protein